ncbi:MAG: hypothetical protein WDZ91_04390, partial [Paenibacillaceae bacterium]
TYCFRTTFHVMFYATLLIETIAVVLVYYAWEIYGEDQDVSNLTSDQWKTVVGRYNAKSEDKQKKYSDKVYEYLDPVQKLLEE